MKNIFPLVNQSKLTDLTVENILFTGESVKMQITNSISENLTDSDLESILYTLYIELESVSFTREVFPTESLFYSKY